MARPKEGQAYLIVDREGGFVYRTNPFGARICELLREGRDVETIVRGLIVSSRPPQSDRVRQDVEKMIRDLVSSGLVERV